ncbi:MAG: c-type cytochrome biogenesis protein CcsB [Desulfobulbaceae bacterium]|uniref:Heme exporter protein C n=1 Tax=Candidatus Desulfobia pelagia TaxID=2841692 RepID=A0A8J6TGH4_9BACT|nr:c-type cytochrome biogenesis protein CcsB [Candidatus Desulfobia pelagia]
MLFTLTFIAYCFATVFYFVFFVSQNKQIRKYARIVLLIAGILHTATIIGRYFATGHTPLTTHHDTVSFFAWAITWAFLSFRWRYEVKNFGTFVSVVIMALMVIAALSSQQVNQLPPALQSKWLPIHASIAILANGFLAMGFCSGIMYLLQEREIKKKRFGLFYSRLPSLEALDNLNHHCLSVGFPMLTLGIITGSFWAKQAWGSYWHWDPKETWSLITWFLYAALLHQRFTSGWRGKRAAIMTIIGFGAVLFTLWGVTYLLPGMHSYVR